ncbi:MAG: NUDIX hydrolase [Candidatus Saelkia tenebricola]|nr:NUDIX hydrolase [Candidatus Saelkia tenebricola]
MAKFKQEISSGGVIYKLNSSSVEIILIRRVTKRGMHAWCLPKGKVEQGESLEVTALREVKEETGVSGKIEKELGSINYWFYGAEDKLKINKTVHFYLMKYMSGNLELYDDEVEEVRWFVIDEARSIASYKSEKEMITKAMEVLIPVPEDK